MSGSARSLSVTMFSGLRVASTNFTPEYSKNGKNVSAKLTVNSFMNIASKANSGDGRNEAVAFTVWGKLAHICAKSMSPGKEWNCIAQLHVYDGRVFQKGTPGQPGAQVLAPDGQPLMTKKFSYTVQMLTFGEESNKHINAEIQAGPHVRPAGWNVAGTPDSLQWKQILLARQAVQFNPAAPTYGYARIYMPQGAGIAAYIPNQVAAVVAAATGPAIDPAAAVAAAFNGVNPAGALPAVGALPMVPPVIAGAQPLVGAPIVSNGFVVPGV
jgi:hypothetical protein